MPRRPVLRSHGRRRVPGRELQEQLGAAIPADHAVQSFGERLIEARVGRPGDRTWRVLDLGCGTGDSIDLFRARDPQVAWTGVDLERSPEVDMRTRTDAEFVRFDGIHLPFPEASFDLVFSNQVLEHVRHPQPLLAEVRRVLAPDGRFCGSTSQLEPFHSHSFWNYTPLGFRVMLEAAGMELIELRPGIDGPALISMRLTGPRRFHRRWWTRSPLNAALDRFGALAGFDAQTLNATKLLFCGQFTFVAAPAGGGAAAGGPAGGGAAAADFVTTP
jgi:SAM-dependent methyltransferase